jgi:FkbM family methyltransferase
MTFVDVGAYAGYFTVLAANWVGASGRVYAFEPEPVAHEFVIRNIQANGYANVVATNMAVTDRKMTVSLVRDPTGPETFISEGPVAGRSQLVATTTLDTFFAAAGWPSVDVIKMNIEGSELSALRGMRELSERNRSLQLVMEFNPPAMRRSGTGREDLTAVLKTLGFHHAEIVERGLEPLPEGQLVPGGRATYNIYLTK